MKMIYWIVGEGKAIDDSIRDAARSYARQMGEAPDVCLVSHRLANLPAIDGFVVKCSESLAYPNMIAVYKQPEYLV